MVLRLVSIPAYCACPPSASGQLQDSQSLHFSSPAGFETYLRVYATASNGGGPLSGQAPGAVWADPGTADEDPHGSPPENVPREEKIAAGGFQRRATREKEEERPWATNRGCLRQSRARQKNKLNKYRWQAGVANAEPRGQSSRGRRDRVAVRVIASRSRFRSRSPPPKPALVCSNLHATLRVALGSAHAGCTAHSKHAVATARLSHHERHSAVAERVSARPSSDGFF